MKIVIPLLLSIFFIPNMVIAQAEKDWKSAQFDQYRIYYPKDWTKEATDNTDDYVKFFLKSPLLSEKDLFQDNVNFAIENIADFQFTLDAYTTLSLSNLKKVFPKIKVVDVTDVNLNGLEAKLAVYGMKVGKYKVLMNQYVFIEDGNAYIITCTIEKKEAAYWNETMKKIAYSISYDF